MAVCSITRIIPAALARPFTISMAEVMAEMHDVPLVRNELITPALFIFIKKSENIKKKKKTEMKKRNFANALVKGSSALYLWNSLASNAFKIFIKPPWDVASVNYFFIKFI